MAGVDETRGSERVPTAIQVTYQVHESMKSSLPFEQGRTTSHIMDLSATGCAILSNGFLPKNVLLDMEIDGAGFFPGQDPSSIKIVGRVCNCRNISKDTYRVGVNFEKIAPRDAKAIKDFIDKNDRRKEKRLQLGPSEPPPET